MTTYEQQVWENPCGLVDCPDCGKTGIAGCFCTTCKTKLPDTWVYTAAQKAKDKANWREPFCITWALLGNFPVGPAFTEWDAA